MLRLYESGYSALPVFILDFDYRLSNSLRHRFPELLDGYSLDLELDRSQTRPDATPRSEEHTSELQSL